MSEIPKKRIVVVGGGTGTHTILKGLKKYTKQLALSAIVSMADSGGSTGRLRDEFGQLPVGDVRMALVALASDTDAYDALLRELLLYRFSRGEGLTGHNFGNLLLTALSDMMGSPTAAIETVTKLLKVQGTVIPVTNDNVHLWAEYGNGEVVIGEHYIDTPSDHLMHERITALSVTPRAELSSAALAALSQADVIIFGPGDLYTSVLANTVVDGFRAAVMASRAEIIYVCNLMSRPGQTNGMHAAEHVRELAAYCGRMPDHVVINTTPLPEAIVVRYAALGTHPILHNCTEEEGYTLYCQDVLATEAITTAEGDILVRSLLRHDSQKLASAIVRIIGLSE